MGKNSKVYLRRRAGRRKKTLSSSLIGCIVIGAIYIGAFYAFGRCGAPHESMGAAQYGNCLEKVILSDELPSIIKQYTGFSLSFNPTWHVPNYVAWELTASETDGATPRKSNFMPDNDILGSPQLDDYRKSGFDRGHMAPAADMKWSTEAMDDSHYLTNMCPQDRSVNGGCWSTLENKCRQWARRDSAIIIIAGPILTDEINHTIGKSEVAVPERFFKVILSPYVNPPRAIGFIVPNSPTHDGIQSMAVSVDQIEQLTGFDFFSCLPDDIETQVEQQAKYHDFDRRKR